jgi:hypothetical protein
MKLFKTLIGIYEELKRLNEVLERAYPPPKPPLTTEEWAESLARFFGKRTPKSKGGAA